MSLATWRASGYSAAVLEQLHRNILARPAAFDYPRERTARLATGATAA
jgi:hypothetical protein